MEEEKKDFELKNDQTIDLTEVKKKKEKNSIKKQIAFYIIIISLLVGLFLRVQTLFERYLGKKTFQESIFMTSPTVTPTTLPQTYSPQTSQEEAIINVVKKTKDAVVSIIITKQVPVYEKYYINPFEEFGFPPEFQIPQFRQKGTEEKEIGGGTGFFVSPDGLIITNNHVVQDKEAQYTVITNKGEKYSARVLIRDTLSDLALLKVEGSGFATIEMGDSDSLLPGQTVIAIGNALGEFRNTISVGVVSGLGRNIVAQGGNVLTTQYDVIQTDAAINEGNSGGPLLNLKGQAIGVNFATVLNAQNIGFALPINRAKKLISQYYQFGKVVYPFIGVKYVIINKNIQKEENLSVDYGALITAPEGEDAIIPNSPAQRAGLKNGDVILEINGEKITQENPLFKIISKYNPGDKITLKILRGKEEKNIEITLEERKENM